MLPNLIWGDVFKTPKKLLNFSNKCFVLNIWLCLLISKGQSTKIYFVIINTL